MSDDDFAFYRPRSDKPAWKRELVAEHMQRLTFLPTDEPKPAPALPETTEEERQAFYVRQDQLFADGYVTVVGAPYPLSRVLAQQLGYDVDHLPQPGEPVFEAGDDEEARDD
jgi:hypothetical protein